MGQRGARAAFNFLGALLLGVPQVAACDLPAGETAAVASVVDGETFQLEDGRKVRLHGLKAPSTPLGWSGRNPRTSPWPFVAEAKQALAQRLPPGTRVELKFDERREDRYGHLLAQVFVTRDDAQIWLQEDLVSDGFARVHSLPDARACVPLLLAAEAQARDARAGLWRSWAYRVQDAHDAKRLGGLTHTYQLVDGTVHAIGEGRKRIYINFAADWRTDFTITLERKKLADFEAAGLDLVGLPGQRIRVRGTLEWWNGPMIAASHPEQIEVLGAATVKGENLEQVNEAQ